jgi:hypothetical protein
MACFCGVGLVSASCSWSLGACRKAKKRLRLGDFSCHAGSCSWNSKRAAFAHTFLGSEYQRGSTPPVQAATKTDIGIISSDLPRQGLLFSQWRFSFAEMLGHAHIHIYIHVLLDACIRSFYLSTYLPIYLSIYSNLSILIYLSIHPSIHPSI